MTKRRIIIVLKLSVKNHLFCTMVLLLRYLRNNFYFNKQDFFQDIVPLVLDLFNVLDVAKLNNAVKSFRRLKWCGEGRRDIG